MKRNKKQNGKQNRKQKAGIWLISAILMAAVSGCGQSGTSWSVFLSDSRETALSEMGAFGITYDGTRYQTDAYMDEAENIYISANALHTIFGQEPDESREWEGVTIGNLTRLCKTLGMQSYQYDETLNAVYIWSRSFAQNTAPESGAHTMRAVSDAVIAHYDEAVITPELLEFAADMPDVSDESVPDWHGLVWVADGEYDARDIDNETFDEMARRWSEWGFDSVRFLLPYQILFSEDGSQADETAFRKLDGVIASAMKYKLHLNICTMSVPGRWCNISESYDYTGEFDLFLNPQRQREAQSVWHTIAARYAPLPNAVLSFTPLWECMNYNLSTGLPVQEYTQQAVADEYMRLIETIREADAGRYVVCELTAVNDIPAVVEASAAMEDIRAKYRNVLLCFNFCEQPFVYANMTAVEGEHIDNCNRSMFLSVYPCAYYQTRSYIGDGEPLVLDGDLHAGTEAVIWLSETADTGQLKLIADGMLLHEEKLSPAQYAVSNPLSRYYPYRESDKKITVTLEKDCEELLVQTEGCAVCWCGIALELPKEYAVTRWFAPSPYEAYLETGEADYSLTPYQKETSTILISPTEDEKPHKLTVHDDISYTTDEVWEQSNAQTIHSWGEAVAGLNAEAAVRIENAGFSGEYLSGVAYYDDFYKMCEEFGYSWFSNDFNYNNYAYVTWDGALDLFFPGSTNIEYADGWIRKELFEMYQRHLPVTAVK